MQRVMSVCVRAAAMLADRVLRDNYGTGFATLETPDGKLTGVVVVALEEENARKLIEFVRSHNRYTEFAAPDRGGDG